MRIFFTVTLMLLLTKTSYCQRADSIKEAANEAVREFTWDIQKEDRGALMFLDVEYQRDNSDSTEYLTLTVAKDKAKQRPEFISIIVPGNVVQSNGIFITFANSVLKNGKQAIEMQKEMPVRVSFESCNNEICTARIVNGFATHDDGKNEDVFQKFMTFDHVLFLFIYPDGSHKSVAVPLFSFKQQYRQL